MGEEYGIDALKSVAIDLAKFGMKIEDVLEDDKLSFGEALNLGIFAAPKAFEHINNAGTIKDQLSDLDANELEELVAAVVTEFDLEADAVEKAIEKGLDALVGLNDFRVAIKEARK